MKREILVCFALILMTIQYEPGTVAYIDCFGEAGYGHVVGSDLYYMPDTDYISAGIPP